MTNTALEPPCKQLPKNTLSSMIAIPIAVDAAPFAQAYAISSQCRAEVVGTIQREDWPMTRSQYCGGTRRTASVEVKPWARGEM